jgi:hypothetical protein
MCDFTGAKTRSDAAPGRCTKTSGYLAFAEINEIIKRSGGDNFDSFYDLASETDVLLYNGWFFVFPSLCLGVLLRPAQGTMSAT